MLKFVSRSLLLALAAEPAIGETDAWEYKSKEYYSFDINSFASMEEKIVALRKNPQPDAGNNFSWQNKA